MTDIKDKDAEPVEAEEVPRTEVALTPLSIIDKAITANIDTDKLEKLMDLQERWEKNQAKKAFDEAMMMFQSKCPIIKKTKRGGVTKQGDVAYMYAPIEDMVSQVKELLAECGFSYLIKTEFIENKVRAICIARHKQGHEEQSVMEIPLLTKTGVMSDAQVVAATVTFAKRYAFGNAFGIMTMDDDSDAVSEDLKAEFEMMLNDWGYKSYLQEVADSLVKATAFRQFIDSIPTAEQVQKFKTLLAKVPEVKHLQLWKDFSKLTNKTALQWLASFESALTKKG